MIHTGIKIRKLLDAAGAATAGVRRGLRGYGIWRSVPVVSNHTLNTLLLGELSARRLRSRMGIVYTTANRNWELHLALVEDRLRQSRALAVDMEFATVAANGFCYRSPTATLLAVSDKPLHAQLRPPADTPLRRPSTLSVPRVGKAGVELRLPCPGSVSRLTRCGLTDGRMPSVRPRDR